MKHAIGFTICLLLSAFPAMGEPPTYSRDVAPIIFENCVSCHREGEIAPMSLSNYQETRPWARSIKRYVSNRTMPPWFANPAHGEFTNNPSLSKKEIATIVKWVKSGAPEGDPANMPKHPEFTQGWQMGEPDAIIELPEVSIPADGNDIFPNVEFSPDIDDSQWLRAIEIRPSNRDVAHHVVIFMSTAGAMSLRDLDILGTWAVGTPPNAYPKGMGRQLRKGQIFTANMHYHPNGTAGKDITRIGLYYGKGKLENEITGRLVGSTFFTIPAGAENHKEVFTFPIRENIRMVSMFPHMHFRGKDMRFTATYPGGRKEILLDVPKYDFDWQLFYYPKTPIDLPAGTKLEIVAHYDNSANNPANPDPTRDVRFGLQSTDEMMFGIFEFIKLGSGGIQGTD